MEWKKLDFEVRRKESMKVMTKYPDRIAVICHSLRPQDPPVDKSKYLVPADLMFGQLVYVIRKRMKLPPSQALFFFVDGKVPAAQQSLQDIYSRYRDADGFLYVTYSAENTFGSAMCSC